MSVSISLPCPSVRVNAVWHSFERPPLFTHGAVRTVPNCIFMGSPIHERRETGEAA